MKLIARFSMAMACVLWVFPVFSTLPTVLEEEMRIFKKISSPKAPENDSDSCDAPIPRGYFEDPRDQKAYNYINLQIQNLTNLRNYYDAKIARLRDKADYYQFQRGEYPLDSQAFLDRIEKYEKIVERIDREIAVLQKQRAELLKKQKVLQ